jgi:hypothetical protein
MPGQVGVPEEQSTWHTKDVVRLTIVVGVALYLFSGVVLRQWLGLRSSDGSQVKYFPAWRMFSDVSEGVMQVRFLERRPDGAKRRIDRFDALNVDRFEQPRGVWRVKGRREALALGTRLCRVLGPGAQVEMITRSVADGDWTRPRRNRKVCEEVR